MKKIVSIILVVLFSFLIGCNSVVDSSSDPIWKNTEKMEPIIKKPDNDPKYPD